MFLNTLFEKYLFDYSRANGQFACDLVSSLCIFSLVVAMLCLGSKCHKCIRRSDVTDKTLDCCWDLLYPLALILLSFLKQSQLKACSSRTRFMLSSGRSDTKKLLNTSLVCATIIRIHGHIYACTLQ